ncbi:MAG: FUSC family protein, partial [Gemmatimonadota bacterium]
ALRANRDYLRAGVELFGDRSESASRVLRAARREVGLAAANAEASFQRLLAEKSPGDVEMAPVMTFLVYSRRLTASIAALAITRHTIETKAVTLEEFLRIVDPVMNDLVETVAERRPPAPFPHLEHTESAIAALPPAVRARLTRLLRQLETLHDALRRWAVAEQLPARAPATAGQTEPV